MRHSELVVIRTFNDRFEAQLAQSALEAAEIESLVRRDAQAARQILDTEPTE
jgi:hypothetical protein